MNAPIELVSHLLQTTGFATWFLDALLKSLVVLSAAGGLCLCWRRASAATRHWIWFLAVASLPCLPLSSALSPSWQRPLWSVSAGSGSGNQISLAIELVPIRTSSVANPEMPAVPPGIPRAGTASSARHLSAHISSTKLAFAVTAWGVGTVLMLAWIVAGQWQLARMSRSTRMVEESEWTSLLAESRERLGLRRRVNLRRSRENLMPMTWGWWRPVLLLPADADTWPAERRRVVLLHELAHVKRWDCLTQLITRIVCALYWFNPLVWVAARRMCVERERACDDQVLNGGWKASDYASHLVEIARSLRRVPQAVAIAMARSSQLGGRVAALVDATRSRRLRSATALAILLGAGAITLCLGGSRASTASSSTAESDLLRQQQIARLQAFSAAKEQQSRTLAAGAGETISPEFQQFFNAATQGDWRTVTNMYESFKRRHPQYERKPGIAEDARLSTPYWGPVLEICLAFDHVANCEPKYTQTAVDEILHSIAAGSIYFGGTDPGRGLPTAFCKSHADADPFFTLTQNALADSTYLDYLRAMYGGKIYTPSTNDLQKCFQDYMVDAQRRLQENKLKPGENVRTDENGKVQISGQVAVMSINGLITKIIFDKNPDREFYIEESFPLDWMYPHLEPDGLIFKINRQPLPELSAEIVQRDHDFWTQCVKPMIGDWLNDDTPVREVAAFAGKVYLKHDFRGFKGDPRFVENDYACRVFSKLRGSIAGIYSWRLGLATGTETPSPHLPRSDAERQRLIKEADFAFKQAFALCPYSPEAVFRYVNFLMRQNRLADALLIAKTASQFEPPNPQLVQLARQLESMQPSPPPLLAFRLVKDGPADDAEPLTYDLPPTAGATKSETLYVQKSVLLDQSAVKSARVVRDNLGRPQINLRFTEAGRKRFAEITRESIDKRLATVVEGRLYMAPVVRTEIAGGEAVIAGNFSEAEAEALAKKLDDAAGK